MSQNQVDPHPYALPRGPAQAAQELGPVLSRRPTWGVPACGEGAEGLRSQRPPATWNPESRYGVKTGLGHRPLRIKGLSQQGLAQGSHWPHTGSQCVQNRH